MNIWVEGDDDLTEGPQRSFNGCVQAKKRAFHSVGLICFVSCRRNKGGRKFETSMQRKMDGRKREKKDQAGI